MPSRFPNCLQMQRGNLERARLLFRKHERFPSPAASAIALVQKEFINESVAAQPLQAVSETQSDIADRLCALENQPDAAQREITQKCDKRGAPLAS